MERRTATVSELVRRAVEVCDPAGVDADLGRLEEQLEDDDAPVTAVDNLEERLAIALEGVDFEIDNPAVSVASAVVLFLATRGADTGYDRDPDELITLAVRRQWGKDPPEQVTDWLAAR